MLAFRAHQIRPQGKVLSGNLSKVEMMESVFVEKADVSLLQSCAFLPQKPLVYTQRHLQFWTQQKQRCVDVADTKKDSFFFFLPHKGK